MENMESFGELIQMAKKKNEIKKLNITSSNVRASELVACEWALLGVFDTYKVTTAEGVFIIERIKFSALHRDEHQQQHIQKKQKQDTSMSMYR